VLVWFLNGFGIREWYYIRKVFMRMDLNFKGVEIKISKDLINEAIKFANKKSETIDPRLQRGSRFRTVSERKRDLFFGKLAEIIAYLLLGTNKPDFEIYVDKNHDDGIDLIDNDGKKYSVNTSKPNAKNLLITRDSFTQNGLGALDKIDYHVFVRIDDEKYVKSRRVFYDIGIINHTNFCKKGVCIILNEGDIIPRTIQSRAWAKSNFCVSVDKLDVPRIKMNKTPSVVI
jgi:hypothetical protein